MTEQEIFFRFVIKDDKGKWDFKKIPKGDVAPWLELNPKAQLIRYALSSDGGNKPFETKEEALKEGKDPKPIILPKRIWEELPDSILEQIYRC